MALEFLNAGDGVTANTAVTDPLFAFSGWFFMPTLANDEVFFMSDGSSNRFGCDVRTNGTVRFFATSATGNGIAITTTTYSTNTWTHIFGVSFSLSSRTVWLNGGGVNNDTGVVTTPVPTTITYGEGGLSADLQLAELAMWTGTGTEAMGDDEALFLAAGFSPLCMTNHLGLLVSYYPLVRDPNWKSVGPALTAIGSPTVANHPRIVYPQDGSDNSIRSPGPFGNRLPPQGIMPLALNLER